MNKYEKFKETYIKAKEAYYNGQPIMSDFEFDTLESQLKIEADVLGINFKSIVGFSDDNRNKKFTHPSRMGSLDKIQSNADRTAPLSSFIDWSFKYPSLIYYATPKFDGNAVNIIYRNGKLDSILSRGNGDAGRDYSDKLDLIIPDNINATAKITEIRGEVVISTEVFNRKYSEYKNERNFVAGILNRDEDVSEIIKDFSFLPIEVRVHRDDEYGSYEFHEVKEFLGTHGGFEIPHELEFNTPEFEFIFESMLSYRKSCYYRLDGFVIKTNIDKRNEYGETSHHPNWAIAIKFPPEEAFTEIVEIRWNFGKTGELTPIAIMNPTPLDGTTVRRATIHNIGWLKSKGCAPGAKVIIAKKGDIIPQIIKVVEPSTQDYQHPEHCPKCDTKLEIENKIRLQCPNINCEGKAYKHFQDGFNKLGLYGIGPAIAEKLWDIGFTSPIDILDKEQFNKANLIESGEFKSGRSLEILLNAVSDIKSLPLRNIIAMMGVENLGKSMSKQIANEIAGIEYSYHGLQKNIVDLFRPGSEKRQLLATNIEMLKENNIKIDYPVAESTDITRYEMTGSPSNFGYKTKKDFIAYAKENGYSHSKLSEASILFTDNLNSSSSKMKTAAKKGVKIMLYSQI